MGDNEDVKSLRDELEKIRFSESDIARSIFSADSDKFWYIDVSRPSSFYISPGFWELLESQYFNGFDSAKLIEAVKSADGTLSFTELIEEFNEEEKEIDFSISDNVAPPVILKSTARAFFYTGTKPRLIINFNLKDQRYPKGSLSIDSSNSVDNMFEIASEIACVGGWEYDVKTGALKWTRITKQIHGVDNDYQPDVSSALDFYAEGWSRELITKLFTKAIEKGVPYDAELQITRADGQQIWVRALGQAIQENGETTKVYGAFQDINDKKSAAQELLTTKSRYQQIYDHSPLGILVLNKEFIVLHINQTARRMFGYEQVEDRNSDEVTYEELLHPEDLERAISFLQKLGTGEIQTYTDEFQMLSRDGTKLWCELHGALLERKGTQNEIIIHIVDITKRKSYEVKSQRIGTWFETIFENSPAGMAVVSKELKWVTINSRLPELLGYTKQEFLKLRLKDVTHPEDLDKDKDKIIELLEGKINYYQSEKRYLRKSGEIAWGNLYVSRVESTDDDYFYIGQVTDSTEQRVSRKRLQKSLDDLQSLMDATTQVFIVGTDKSGIIEKFNKGAENMTGYKSEEVIGHDYLEFFHQQIELDQHRRMVEKKTDKSLPDFKLVEFTAENKEFQQNEWKILQKNGGHFQSQMMVSHITDSSGEVAGYLMVAIDISELKQLERSLIRAKNTAEKANNSKSQFLANMSHEIRTPLNAVIGFSDLMKSTDLSITQEQYMELISNSAVSLLDLINDILDFSKIEAGKLDISPEWVDVVEVCAQALDIIKYEAQKKELSLSLQIDIGNSRFVYMDPLRVRQVLTNLLGNAVKFTERGYLQLELKFKTKLSGGAGLFEFAVHDSGKGIDKNKLSRIFNAFEQEDTSVTRKFGGTGLGLTISNRILKQMDSHLNVNSKIGEGSRFSFMLSLRMDVPKDLLGRSRRRIDRVLTVHPEKLEAHLLSDMLAVDNVICDYAPTAAHAMKMIQSRVHYDVLIIDKHLDDRDGLELIRTLKGPPSIIDSNVKIVLTYDEEYGKIKVTPEDKSIINAFIPSPIETYQIFRRISNLKLEDRSSNSKQSVTPSSGNKSSFKVLIAEDNQVNMFLAKSLIKRLLPNIQISEAENGEEAISIYEKKNIDIIFMDVQMPVMDGMEASKRIREMDKNIPIIGLSARASKEDVDEGKASGMNHYIRKPVDVEEVNTVLTTYLINAN